MARIRTAFLPSGVVNESAVAEAATHLRSGQLVAIPTETVYGLAANALDASAVRRIFEAKGRPSFNPLIVHVATIEDARQLSSDWTEAADRLAQKFWPGPLSLVVRKSPQIPDAVTAGLDSVAIRMPAHLIARVVLERAGLPLAAPSANRSNAVSPTTAEHVLASLGDRIDLILDGGPCVVGIESTVVDVTGSESIVLRPGGISAAQIAELVGRVRIGSHPSGSEARASPGQLARHYSPNAITLLFTAAELPALLSSLPSDAKVGAVARTIARPPNARVIAWEILPDDPVLFAHDLYAALHRVEAAGVTHVLLERAPDGAEWRAVRDRLERAAGPA